MINVLICLNTENTSRSIKDGIQQSPLKEFEDKEVLTDLESQNRSTNDLLSGQ